MENFKKLTKLHQNDNVLVVIVNLKNGDVVEYDNTTYHLFQDINLGHKIATKDIQKGDKIIKYNVVIGSATANIKKGEHVHVHNMTSDFIESHLIDEEK